MKESIRGRRYFLTANVAKWGFISKVRSDSTFIIQLRQMNDHCPPGPVLQERGSYIARHNKQGTDHPHQVPEEKKKKKSSVFILHNLSRKTTARLKRFHGPPFLFIKRQNSISTSSLHYLPYLVISRRHNHMYLGTLKYLQSIRTTHIAYLYTCTS